MRDEQGERIIDRARDEQRDNYYDLDFHNHGLLTRKPSL